MNDIKMRQRNNTIYREKLLEKPTQCELIVKEKLDELGIRYIFQKGFIKPFHRIVDFYIPKGKIIIEVDGGYHKETTEKDIRKDSEFKKKRKMRTLRILNDDVLSGEYIEKLIDIAK